MWRDRPGDGETSAGPAGDEEDEGGEERDEEAGEGGGARSRPPGRRSWEEMDALRARMVRDGYDGVPELSARERERVWGSLVERRRRPQLRVLLGITDEELDDAVAWVRRERQAALARR